MHPQESRPNPTTRQPAPLDAPFTGAEKAQLSHLRQRVASHPDPLDAAGLERRRLEFARWLVQQGKLAEA
jgi:hypothetical protein